nr:hypothetical protein [Tanacetum cinerariifolium]
MKKEEKESSDGGWSNYVPNDEWKHLKLDRINNNDEVKENQKCIGGYEPTIDDDFGYIHDYLVSKDTPFIINMEGRVEEKRYKLRGTPRERIARIEHEFDIWERTKGYIYIYDGEVVEFATRT